MILPIILNGQDLMYSVDNNIRGPNGPASAGYKNQIYMSALSYQSNFGQIRSNTYVFGGDAQLGLGLKRTNGFLGIGSYIYQSNFEYWKETSFNLSLSSNIEIAKGVFAGIGFKGTLFQYGQPEELTREEYLDDVFLDMKETQTLSKISWGLTVQSENFFFDFSHLNFQTFVFGGTAPKFKELPIWKINTSYIFKQNSRNTANPIGIRPGLMFDIEGLFNSEYEKTYLMRPNIEFLFLNDRLWFEYMFIKSNSLDKSEFANRLLVGFGTHLNISFAYTFGNSQLYKNSQGNFELIVVYDINRREKDKNTKKFKGSPSCKQVFKLPKSYKKKRR